MAHKIIIEDAHIKFRNFRGIASTFNKEGDRNFCVDVDHELAEKLTQDGWLVKYSKPRNPSDEPQPYIKVKVSYRYTQPKVVLISSEGRTLLDEETIGTLDWADIEKVDVVITPSYYEFNGRTGISAYLKSMYVTVEEDDLEKKYARDGMRDYVPSHFDE